MPWNECKPTCHVEPRIAPTIINVIFNKLQFWDGRVKETFNGVNIQGDIDPTAFGLRAPTGNTLTQVQISLDNSSLASLVTGAPLNISEMSAGGRIHPEIGTKFLRRAGKKLSKLRPLAKLEFTRASVRRTVGVTSTDPDNPLINNAANGVFANYGVRPANDDPGAGNAITSRFKAPGLMNIALTAPYFHHGGMATLEEVVQFYNRGRDFNTAPGAPLNLSEDAQADLVAFLRNSLTDPRVLNEQAPFDHPQIFVPNGHPGDHTSVTARGSENGTPQATDELIEIPAAGTSGVKTPPPNFLEE